MHKGMSYSIIIFVPRQEISLYSYGVPEDWHDVHVCGARQFLHT